MDSFSFVLLFARGCVRTYIQEVVGLFVTAAFRALVVPSIVKLVVASDLVIEERERCGWMSYLAVLLWPLPPSALPCFGRHFLDCCVGVHAVLVSFEFSCMFGRALVT